MGGQEGKECVESTIRCFETSSKAEYFVEENNTYGIANDWQILRRFLKIPTKWKTVLRGGW
jgi:hypothetical protein